MAKECVVNKLYTHIRLSAFNGATNTTTLRGVASNKMLGRPIRKIIDCRGQILSLGGYNINSFTASFPYLDLAKSKGFLSGRE